MKQRKINGMAFLDLMKYIIKALCAAVTLVLVGMWVRRYCLDKDSSVLENRHYFDDKDDVFPVMSMCFRQNFADDDMKKWGKNISGSAYEDFLFGRYFDTNMTYIDYHSVSTNISKYILSYDVEFRNGSYVQDTLANLAWKPLYYTLTWNSWGRLVKCFGLEITDKDVYFVRVFMNRDVFTDRIRNSNGGFAVLFHYPNQVLSSAQTVKRQWIVRDNITNHYMSFNLKGMDVNLQRYKKDEGNCIPDWKNYDNITLERHLSKTGCKTPDQSTNDTWTVCQNKEAMKKARIHLNRIALRPCREVESIDYDMGESESTRTGRNFHSKYCEHWIGFVLRILNPRFKVILQQKEVDLQTLIGYIGGYIGIFTGFALAQIPDYVLFAFVLTKRRFLSFKNGCNIVA